MDDLEWEKIRRLEKKYSHIFNDRCEDAYETRIHIDYSSALLNHRLEDPYFLAKIKNKNERKAVDLEYKSHILRRRREEIFNNPSRPIENNGMLNHLEENEVNTLNERIEQYDKEVDYYNKLALEEKIKNLEEKI